MFDPNEETIQCKKGDFILKSVHEKWWKKYCDPLFKAALVNIFTLMADEMTYNVKGLTYNNITHR